MATTLTPATLAGLVTGARQRANLVNSGFIAAGAGAEEETYVQVAAQTLHSILVTNDPDGYAVTALLVTPDTAAPFINWTLPGDFGFLVKVTYPLTGRARKVPKITLDEFIDATAAGAAAPFPAGYIRQGTTIRFGPGAQTATPGPTIYYIAGQVALGGAPAVTFDGVDGWDIWIEIDVAIRMLVKEGDNGAAVKLLLAEREKTEARIISQVKTRDIGEPPKAIDTERATYMWPPPLPPP